MLSWLRGHPSKEVQRSPTPESAFERPTGEIPSSLTRARNPRSLRVYFDLNAAIVVGRPPKGGILSKHVNAVDLAHLKVSRKEETAIPEPGDVANEEAWCLQLQRLGAQWWRSFEDWDDALNGVRPRTDVEQEMVYVGRPSTGGVWVLKVVKGRKPVGFGKYEMCLNMDERCSVLQSFGAQFFEDPEECFELTTGYAERFRQQRDQLEDDFGDFH